MQLKGLPEGVEAVEYRVPVENEFVVASGQIRRASAAEVSWGPALVVRPAAGCRFEWDIRTNKYVVARPFAPKQIQAIVTVTSSLEEAQVRAAIADLPNNPVIEEL